MPKKLLLLSSQRGKNTVSSELNLDISETKVIIGYTLMYEDK